MAQVLLFVLLLVAAVILVAAIDQLRPRAGKSAPRAKGNVANASTARPASAAARERAAAAGASATPRDAEARAARAAKPAISGGDEAPPIAGEFLPPRTLELWRPLTHAETPSFVIESFAERSPSL